MKTKNKGKVVFLFVILIVIISATMLLFLSNNNKISNDGTVTFRAKIISHQTDYLDGPGRYKLDNGKTVEYSCGFCALRFEGQVMGGPTTGDTVEIKANENYPDPNNDVDYYIYDSGLYIKKL